MAFFSDKVTLASGSTADTMHAIYTMVNNGSQTAVTFVMDGGVRSISLNGTTYDTPSGTGSWAINSYMVLQVGCVQIKIVRTATDGVGVLAAMDLNGGGWASKAFQGTQAKTAQVSWLNITPLAGDVVYLSSDDTVTDSGGTVRPACLINFYQPTQGEDS